MSACIKRTFNYTFIYLFVQPLHFQKKKKSFYLLACFASLYFSLWRFINLNGNLHLTKAVLQPASIKTHLYHEEFEIWHDEVSRRLYSHEEISARISAPKGLKLDLLCLRKSHHSCLCSVDTPQITISHLSIRVNHEKTFTNRLQKLEIHVFFRV